MSHPAVPARRFSREPARAGSARARPDIATARLPRSHSRHADLPAPARRRFAPPGARCLLCHAPIVRSPNEPSSKLTARFFPPRPRLSRIAARYRAQLDAKLSHLADLQARWNAQGVFDVVKALRRDFGDTGDDDVKKVRPRDDAERKPREPWIQHEKESVRKALLLFGLGRWAKLRMALKPASRPRHDSHGRATGDLGPGEGHAPKAGTGLAGGQVPRG